MFSFYRKAAREARRKRVTNSLWMPVSPAALGKGLHTNVWYTVALRQSNCPVILSCHYGKGKAMARRKLHPIHPGEVLLEEFLKPLQMSQNRLALDIGVPARRVNEIVLGKRSVSADTALRLARYFATTPQFWLGLQADYDLDVTADRLRGRIRREVRPLKSATA
jgi:addiction module HigA family antidote